MILYLQLPPADASPEEHAAALLEIARVHPNLAGALRLLGNAKYYEGKNMVKRRASLYYRNIEILRAGKEWKQGARWAIEKIIQP